MSETASVRAQPWRLWTPPETAEALGVSLPTVYSWAASGFLPCVRLGRAVRFDPQMVRAWVERRSAPPAPVMSIRKG
jgi:excisionase family DNA binding protein